MAFEDDLIKFYKLLELADEYNRKFHPAHGRYGQCFKMLYPCIGYPNGAIFFNDNTNDFAKKMVGLLWDEAMCSVENNCTINKVI